MLLFLSVVALIFLGISAFFASTASSNCTASSASPCSVDTRTIAALIFLGLGAIPWIAVWIIGLVKTIQAKSWGWFVAVLLLSPLSTLAYGLFGPA